MFLETQYKIKANTNLSNYLKENSYWYKYLNRNREYIKLFEENMKQKYKLTAKDRVEKVVENIDKVSKFISIFK